MHNMSFVDLRVVRRPLFAIIVTLASILGLADAGRACLELPDNPPDIWVQGDACEDGGLTVTIHDYTTFAASDHYCACALNLPLTFGLVTGAQVIDRATGLVIPGFDFTIDPDADFGGSSDWQGLASSLLTVPAGISVDLRFQIAPPQKARCEDAAELLAGALESPPAPGLVGTGGADENGVPNDHIGITDADVVAIELIGDRLLDQAATNTCAVISDAGFSQSRAESFVLGGTVHQRLQHLEVIGAYLFSGTMPPSDLFAVSLYPDAGGLPDATPITGCQFPGVVPTTRIPTGGTTGGLPLLAFTFHLPPTCVLAPGQRYWLELYETQNELDHFAWACGVTDPDHGQPGSASAATTPGSGWTAAGQDLAMTLSATGIAFGLPHGPLGTAEAGKDARGALVVSNLGSSGQDGVVIDLGESQSHTIGFAPEALAPDLPDGASVRFTTIGELDAQPDQPIWTLQVEDLGNRFGLSLDAAAVQPGSLRIEARLGDTVVDQVEVMPTDDTLALFTQEGCIIDTFWPEVPECWAVVTLEAPGPVTLVGSGATVMADSIVVASVDQAGVVSSLSATVMQTSQIPSFTIFDETIGLFGFHHRAWGEARLTGRGDRLHVSNLGSSGQDGVSIALDEADTVEAKIEPLTFTDPGDQLILGATGTFQGNPHTTLGTASLVRVGNDLEMRTDYSPIGAMNVRVEVRANGAIVGSYRTGDGTVGRILGTPSPSSCGKRPELPPTQLPCFFCEFPGQITVVNPLGTITLVGDAVHLLAEDATGTLESLGSFELHAAGIPSLTLTGVSTDLPAGPIFRDGFESGDTSAWDTVVP